MQRRESLNKLEMDVGMYQGRGKVVTVLNQVPRHENISPVRIEEVEVQIQAFSI
jgi:hypothetical protein